MLAQVLAVGIFLTFMVMSFGLAMFIDGITVILFLAAAPVEFGAKLDLSIDECGMARLYCLRSLGRAFWMKSF